MHRWKVKIKETGSIYFKEVFKDGYTFTYSKGIDNFFKPSNAVVLPLQSHKMVFLDFSK